MSPDISPATSATPTSRTLLVIGGAEDKVGRATILRRFARLAGGRRASIVILPTASSVPHEASESYTRVFSRLRAGRATTLDPSSRAKPDEEGLVRVLDAATGIFLSGGNQLRLSQLIVGTGVGDAIARAYERGAVVAGTSAGASVLSRFMVSLGDEGVTPRQGHSQLTAGLGLLPEVIVDQHFDQRARYGRLLSLVAGSPNLFGMGVDEDTAAEISDERRVHVVGSGAVFLVDARSAVSDAHEAREDAPLLVSGAVVHSLPSGATFDLGNATLTDFTEQHPGVEAVASTEDTHGPATALRSAGEGR